ncbi:NUDIX domain-containing protein [Candidatus Kaiserbacteria bacterium]|nr:NUDIX domain-containing protein [Candidatus Kaiserbacteria bacterium]
MQSKEVHFCGKVAQKAIIDNGKGEILIVRDPRESEEVWEIPGGRINEDEEPKSALAREIKEELGVEVEVGEVLSLEQFWQHSDQAKALLIVYVCRMKNPNASLNLEAKEVAEARWVTATECDKLNFFVEYQRAIKKYFSDKI